MPGGALPAATRPESAWAERAHPRRLGTAGPTGARPSLLHLAATLRRRQFDAAVVVHPTARAILACWLAGIPLRAGRASNLWQFGLNHGLAQHRSRNEKHESAYNVDLVVPLGCPPAWEPPRLAPSMATMAAGREALRRAGLGEARPVFVHPGHGGSAVNLPLAGYRALVERLQADGRAVALTLGPGEMALAEEFPPPQAGRFGVVADTPDLGFLQGLLAHGSGFLGGSTGPMHLAAALGIPTVAFFPLLPAMTPRRWGPCGPHTLVVQPADTTCPGRCAGCRRGNCLAAIELGPPLAWLATRADSPPLGGLA